MISSSLPPSPSTNFVATIAHLAGRLFDQKISRNRNFPAVEEKIRLSPVSAERFSFGRTQLPKLAGTLRFRFISFTIDRAVPDRVRKMRPRNRIVARRFLQKGRTNAFSLQRATNGSFRRWRANGARIVQPHGRDGSQAARRA